MFCAPDPSLVVMGGPKSQIDGWNMLSVRIKAKIRKNSIEKIYGSKEEKEVRR